MILVDTSVWVDHLRATNQILARRRLGTRPSRHHRPALLGQPETARGRINRPIVRLQTIIEKDQDALYFIQPEILAGNIVYIDI